MSDREQTLTEVCHEVRSRMHQGESWDRNLFDFIVKQPAVLSEIRRQAERLRWIDKSMAIEELALDVLGVFWERLNGLRLAIAQSCQALFITFIRKCFWHLPTSKQRRRDTQYRDESMDEPMVDCNSSVAETKACCQTEVLAEYQEKLIESALQAALRRLPRLDAVALRLILKHEMPQKEVADVCGLAESSISEMLQKAKVKVQEMLDDWRTGFWEVDDG